MKARRQEATMTSGHSSDRGNKMKAAQKKRHKLRQASIEMSHRMANGPSIHGVMVR